MTDMTEDYATLTELEAYGGCLAYLVMALGIPAMVIWFIWRVG